MANLQIQADENKRFWFCYGTEKYMLTETAQSICNSYLQSEAAQPDMVTVEGPVPDMDAVLNAVGTISMFGGVRLVYVPEIEVSAMQDKEVKEFCDLMESMENAVVVAFSVMKDTKQANTKKSKLFIETANRIGKALEVKKLTKRELGQYLVQEAEKMNTKLKQKDAEILIEVTGEDVPLLENELQKLAAAENYSEITTDIIESFATKTLETDVFEILNAAFAKNTKKAYEKMKHLLDAGHSEVMISGALAGSFIDMYRVKLGKETGHSYSQVYKDMGYTGNEYRLQKSAERAARYSLEKLETAVEILAQLDKTLKSSSVNSGILLENALAELISL